MRQSRSMLGFETRPQRVNTLLTKLFRYCINYLFRSVSFYYKHGVAGLKCTWPARKDKRFMLRIKLNCAGVNVLSLSLIVARKERRWFQETLVNLRTHEVGRWAAELRAVVDHLCRRTCIVTKFFKCFEFDVSYRA